MNRTSGTMFPRRLPGRSSALDEQTVLFDGLKVVFDQTVALAPVNLTRSVDPSQRARVERDRRFEEEP